MADATMVDVGIRPPQPEVRGDGSPFQELSMEVFLRITFWLSTPDLCSTRLSCRAFKDFLQASFIQEFISQKQFMLSPFSLQTLVDISKSPLAVHLRRLQLGTDKLTMGADGVSVAQPEGIEAMRLMQAQTTFIRDGSHRKLLAQAFRNLHDASRSGLRPDFEIVVRDFNSRRRTRDFTDWRSYGMTTAKSLGLRCRMEDPTCNTTMVFRSVLVALADAGVRAAGIEVMSRWTGEALINEAAFFINANEPAIPAVLAGLTKLHVVTGKSVMSDSMMHEFDPDGLGGGAYSVINDLPEFLSHCTNLKELRVNHRGSLVKESEAFFIWLSRDPTSVSEPSQANLRPWPAPASFNNLESLSFGVTTTRPDNFLKIITRLTPTLRSLQFYMVTLATRIEDSDDFFEQMTDCDGWRRFLEALAEIKQLDLRYILASSLDEAFYSAPSSRTLFKRHASFNGNLAASGGRVINGYKEPDGNIFYHGYEYRGMDCKNAFREMALSLESPHVELETFKNYLRNHNAPMVTGNSSDSNTWSSDEE